MLSSLLQSKKLKRNQKVHVFAESYCSAYKLPLGVLCKVVDLAGLGNEIRVKPIGDTDNKRSNWVPREKVLPIKLVTNIVTRFSTAKLRVALPPFAKEGDRVSVDSNGFINVNDELFLELNEFSNLI